MRSSLPVAADARANFRFAPPHRPRRPAAAQTIMAKPAAKKPAAVKKVHARPRPKATPTQWRAGAASAPGGHGASLRACPSSSKRAHTFLTLLTSGRCLARSPSPRSPRPRRPPRRSRRPRRPPRRRPRPRSPRPRRSKRPACGLVQCAAHLAPWRAGLAFAVVVEEGEGRGWLPGEGRSASML